MTWLGATTCLGVAYVLLDTAYLRRKKEIDLLRETKEELEEFSDASGPLRNITLAQRIG